jgi:hypothetical protein
VIAVVALARLGLAIADAGATESIDGVGAPEGGVATAAFEAFGFTAFAAIGALVASRQPRNPIGWLLAGAPFALAVGTLCERLAWHDLLQERSVSDFAEFALWIPNWSWVLTVVPIFAAVPLLFPTGRPLTRRWRPLGWMALAGGCALAIGYAFAPGELDSYPGVQNPLGAGDDLGQAVDALGLLGFWLVVAATLGGVTSLAVRFRRSRGIERQQIKWVWAAAGLLVVSFVASGLVENVVSEEASWPILLAGLLGVPSAVAIAILRHRLYDIDVVVNRTLVYGSLTATLALAYLACVLILQLALRPVTEESSLAIAVSTLAVAALSVLRAGDSRASWTVASTGASTTPRRRSSHSPPGFATRSTWRAWARSCAPCCTRRCSRPTYRCGCEGRPSRACRQAERSAAASWRSILRCGRDARRADRGSVRRPPSPAVRRGR